MYTGPRSDGTGSQDYALLAREAAERLEYARRNDGVTWVLVMLDAAYRVCEQPPGNVFDSLRELHYIVRDWQEVLISEEIARRRTP